MLEFWPGWMTYEVEQALLVIDEGARSRWTPYKVRTVLVLADGLAQGRSKRELLGQADTCSRSCWEHKWAQDAAIKAALDEALRAAQRWESKKTARALALAREQLELQAPENVAAMVRARQDLEVVRGEAKDLGTRIRADVRVVEVAGKMLDRLEETADRSGGELRVRFIKPERERKVAADGD